MHILVISTVLFVLFLVPLSEIKMCCLIKVNYIEVDVCYKHFCMNEFEANDFSDVSELHVCKFLLVPFNRYAGVT